MEIKAREGAGSTPTPSSETRNQQGASWFISYRFLLGHSWSFSPAGWLSPTTPESGQRSLPFMVVGYGGACTPFVGRDPPDKALNSRSQGDTTPFAAVVRSENLAEDDDGTSHVITPRDDHVVAQSGNCEGVWRVGLPRKPYAYMRPVVKRQACVHGGVTTRYVGEDYVADKQTRCGAAHRNKSAHKRCGVGKSGVPACLMSAFATVHCTTVILPQTLCLFATSAVKARDRQFKSAPRNQNTHADELWAGAAANPPIF